MDVSKVEWKFVLVAFFFLINVVNMQQSFSLLVDILSVENRGGRCADAAACDSGQGCCESSTCAITTCQYAIQTCKSLNAEYSINEPSVACENPRITELEVFERNGSIGKRNRYIYSDVPDDGLMLFAELLHNNTVLIDRFLIISSEVGTPVGPTILEGLFGYASIEITTIIRCRAGYCNANCSEMNETCICEPGYTGEDCNIEIDDCDGVSCPNSNFRCVDLFITHNCICLPGFTGPTCNIDIDECSDGQEYCSSNGKCVNDEGSFHCECHKGYTGVYCESDLERFVLEIVIHSIIHPGGRCIDVGGTCANGSGCCDDEECMDTSCDYMFLFCQRPVGTNISYARSENRGNCNFTETDSFSNMSKIENIIIYRKLTSPINVSEFYIELIDDDHNTIAANNELIDRFVVPITRNLTYNLIPGIFDIAFLLLSVNVYCSEEFLVGDNCSYSQEMVEGNEIPTAVNRSTINSVSVDSSTKVMLVLLIIVSTLLILALVVIGVILFYIKIKLYKVAHIQKKEGQSTENIQIYETISAGNPLTISSVRNRLESLPNSYDVTHQKHRPCPSQQLLPQTTTPVHQHTAGTEPEITLEDLSDVYNFSPTGDDAVDDYDYEAPYWEPSNVEKELLSQLKILKIQSAESHELQELEIIGHGAFGKVIKGIWNHLVAFNSFIKEEVAVKMIEGGASEDERIQFIKEAAIMGQFNHPNIIRIKGIVSNNELEEYKIIMEYMPKGNLRGHLPTLDKSSDTLCSQLLAFSRQIANGMNYLGLKSYVHRDLAARNILISEENTCKICDFGLSRDIQSESFYLAHGGKIPVKWAAPESINYKVWSTASDVWSYGCVLYEIWSLGYKPFHNCNNSKAIEKIMQGLRLAPPPGCPRVIYELMINCWNADSESRPTFCQIMSILNEPEYKIIKWSEEDKSSYSEESRTIGEQLQNGASLFIELQNTYKK